MRHQERWLKDRKRPKKRRQRHSRHITHFTGVVSLPVGGYTSHAHTQSALYVVVPKPKWSSYSPLVLQKYRYEIAAPDILNQKFQDWS
jgi:hypothetical protein